MRRVFSLRFISFAITPLVLVLLAAETTLRFKYFFAHDHDWHYLTTPFPLDARSLSLELEMPAQMRAALQTPSTPPQPATPEVSVAAVVAAPAPPAAEGVASPATTLATTPATTPAATPAATPEPARAQPVPAPPTPAALATPSAPGAAPTPDVQPTAAPAATAAGPAPPVAVTPIEQPRARTARAPDAPATRPVAPPPRATRQDQMVFLWPTPCVSGKVYSTERRVVLPRTWDENCFRGDRVTRETNAAEFRVVFLGGSTVQGFQSDEEMMTAQFKQFFRRTPPGKQLTVVNAGRPGFDSRRILEDYRSRVSRFPIDLALYYEAWNEQPTDVKPSMKADRIIAHVRNPLHATLYQRSLLYTYLVEKYAFLATAGAKFWKIEVGTLRTSFNELAREVRRGGTRFVFITQVIRFPRMWKGVDTFDFQAVNTLLDRLKADPRYVYDVTEISALNQRLAVLYTLGLCQEHGVPAINIIEPVEALGEAGRAELFMDLGHLTVKGDRVVGGLVAARLNLPD